MSKTFNRLLNGALAAAFSAALLCGSGAAGARTAVDDNGDAVELPESVERAVVANILPLGSAAVVYSGDAKRVVGMHPASLSAAAGGLTGRFYPDALKTPTGFIQGANLNIESLLALKPDVVLVNAPDRRMLERVRAAGLTAFGVSPTKWNYDVVETFTGWVNALEAVFPDGKAKGEFLKSEMRRAADLVASRVKDIPESEKPSVLFVVRTDGRQLVVSGRRFFGESWCALAGAKNAAHGIAAENANAAVTMESVYAWNPDVVLLTNFTPLSPADLYAGRDAGRDWSHVKAVAGKAVHKMPLGVYRTFTPSLDAPVTLIWLAKTLHPARFADVDVRAWAKDYYKKGFGLELTDADVERMFSPDARAAKNASTNVKSGR